MRRRFLRFQITAIVTASLVFSFGKKAEAQSSRYELGRRLIAVESAWEATKDTALRSTAVASLKQAVASFFTGNASSTARALDEAYGALLRRSPVDTLAAFGASLFIQPAARFIDTEAGMFKIQIGQIYGVSMSAMPMRVRYFISGPSGQTRPQEFSLRALPHDVNIRIASLREGEYVVQLEFLRGDTAVATRLVRFSASKSMRARIDSLRARAASLSRSTDSETIRGLCATVDSLSRGVQYEIDYPASLLLRNAEAALIEHARGKRTAEIFSSGVHWMRIALDSAIVNTRVMIPKKASARIPLVVALHGAGGSENLFFEGYGNGKIARLCTERGWMLVAPRTSIFGALPINQLVSEIMKLYPIDSSQIFIIGHSMGAAQALAAISQMPDRYNAVAILGAGGTLKNASQVRRTRFFIGAGTEDFGVKTARSFNESLRKTAFMQIDYREYPRTEHFTIVQEALNDAFAFFSKK